MHVSIIVPVYNTEKYLKKCFKSITEQTYSNLEIIIVDDGSTDDSGRLCDEYAQFDDRVMVIHKENGGLSSARNEGLRNSTGEYLTFVDSDDYISKDFVEKSLDLCKKYGADISVLNMVYVSETYNDECFVSDKIDITELTREEAIKASLYQKLFSCCAPGKLYRNNTFNNIEFPLNRLSEDLAVCHRILNNANKVVCSTEIGYYYRQQKSSIMHNFNPRRLDAIEWTRSIEHFCLDYYPDLINAALCRSFNVSIHLLLDLPDDDKYHDDYKNVVWSEIVRTRKTVLYDSEVRFREKAAAFLSFFGEKVLKKVWNSKLAIKK